MLPPPPPPPPRRMRLARRVPPPRRWRRPQPQVKGLVVVFFFLFFFCSRAFTSLVRWGSSVIIRVRSFAQRKASHRGILKSQHVKRGFGGFYDSGVER